jgi:hypothetical protein
MIRFDMSDAGYVIWKELLAPHLVPQSQKKE